MILVLTAEAEDDLERIGDHIAKDNPSRAASFVAEFVERCEHLARMPEAFSVVPRFERSGVRRRVHGRYLIFYRITPERIEALHILDGAQDYESILFPPS